MKYFSTFSGIGGFEIGIGSDHECVGYSEIDKYATQVYQKHFPNHTNYGDITTINADKLPDFDLLVGGFPCQSFSVAGRRKGFLDETRGTLFFDLARILSSKRPRYFIFENVKGLLSHNGGTTFDTIIATLDELGYDLQWQVLNSKDWGVPQNRERVFIVGHLRGEPRPQVFPLIPGHREDHKPDKVQTAIRYPLKFANRNQRKIEGDYAYTVDSMNTGGVMVFKSIRKLTPRECERLQGFPDNWTAIGVNGVISDSQRYKMCGNAVTVNVIEKIIHNLNL